MSRLTGLIEELCPDGVEYRSLGEVIERLRTGLNPRKNFVLNSPGATNFYVTVRELGGFRIETSDKTDRVDNEGLRLIQNRSGLKAGDVLFSGTGTIGRTALVSDDPTNWNIKEGVYAITPCQGVMDSRFLVYVLNSSEFKDTALARAAGGTVKSISMRNLQLISLPVPPLEVQQELVRVLDAFTDLEQSLVSELELRKKQLVDYRHACFARVQEEDGNIVSLCEAVEVRSGWGFPKSFQGVSDGEFPFFKVGDMNLSGNERFMTSANNYISETDAVDLKIDPAPAGTVIFPKIGAAIATNKKRILTQDSAFDNNVMGLVPYDEVNPDYLFHWIQTVNLVRWGNSSGGVPSIRKTDVAKVPFFLPTRDLQKTVAIMFNAFESLIQNIEQELTLRRKQYEFYRDELLSFTAKEA